MIPMYLERDASVDDYIDLDESIFTNKLVILTDDDIIAEKKVISEAYEHQSIVPEAYKSKHHFKFNKC